MLGVTTHAIISLALKTFDIHILRVIETGRLLEIAQFIYRDRDSKCRTQNVTSTEIESLW